MQRHPQRPQGMAIGLVVAATVLFGAFSGQAGSLDPSFTDFEEDGFTPGETVDNHKPDGTESDPQIEFIRQCVQAWFVPAARAGTPQDEEVVDLNGNKVWRFSQAGPVRLLGQNPHSPNNGNVTPLTAGEAGAANDAGCGAPTTANFYAEVMFTSATGGSQPNLQMDVMANSGDTRHAFVRIVDDGVGNIDLGFFDTVNGCEFNFTPIDSNLDPGLWHRLGIEIFFVDGLDEGTAGVPGAFGNDIVNIYVNETLVHTGTTWESCVGARSVDRLLFSYGVQQASHDGNGLYFDDVLVTDLCPEGNCQEAPDFDSVGECISTRFDENCKGLTGRDRAECNHEQQAFCHDLFGVPSSHTNDN